MKIQYESSLERGRTLVKYLMAFAVILGLAGLLLTPAGSVAQFVLVMLSAGMLVAMIVAIWKTCRCPYCGKHIFFGALVVTVCPSCHRNLSSGKKVKKSKR